MYQARVFFDSRTVRAHGETVEKTLASLCKSVGFRLTYRPMDGEVFVPGAPCAIGAIFQTDINGHDGTRKG